MLRLIIVGIVVGVASTFLMDIGATLLRALRLTAGIPLPIAAKWMNYGVRRGKIVHDDIAKSPELPRSMPLAMLVHYLIGIVLAITYLVLLHVLALGHGSFWLAVVYGIVTTVFAWFSCCPRWDTVSCDCKRRRTGASVDPPSPITCSTESGSVSSSTFWV